MLRRVGMEKDTPVEGLPDIILFPSNGSLSVLIGRGKDCEYRIVDNIKGSSFISKHHAKLSTICIGGCTNYYLHSLDAMNGVFVNTKRMDNFCTKELYPCDIVGFATDKTFPFTNPKGSLIRYIYQFEMNPSTSSKILHSNQLSFRHTSAPSIQLSEVRNLKKKVEFLINLNSSKQRIQQQIPISMATLPHPSFPNNIPSVHPKNYTIKHHVSDDNVAAAGELPANSSDQQSSSSDVGVVASVLPKPEVSSGLLNQRLDASKKSENHILHIVSSSGDMNMKSSCSTAKASKTVPTASNDPRPIVLLDSPSKTLLHTSIRKDSSLLSNSIVVDLTSSETDGSHPIKRVSSNNGVIEHLPPSPSRRGVHKVANSGVPIIVDAEAESDSKPIGSYNSTVEHNNTNKSIHKILAENECTICSDLIACCYALQCSHSFCGACLLDWLIRERTCPTCREPVTCVPYKVRQVDSTTEFLSSHMDEEGRKVHKRKLSEWNDDQALKLISLFTSINPKQGSRSKIRK